MTAIRYLLVFNVLCLMTPALMGVVDTWMWLVLGKPVFWIDWNPVRVAVAALFWSIGAILLQVVVRLREIAKTSAPK